MLIHSVTLNNIRSYKQETVEFDEGITLLAGDIGSGKSTILLAIEFALFGIRRGDISGDGLLRHGEKEGFVTLTFSTNQTVTVHRQLKRTSQGVRQDTGYLEIDGRKESLTANELKARILDIIGYPEYLLTKTKGFVFRYTVYTPQEEMKQILFESDSARLDTLRNVFGVDRYQRVQENAQLLAKQLRDDKRFLNQQLVDEEDISGHAKALKQKQQETTQELLSVKQDIVEQQAVVERAKKQVSALKESFAKEHARQKKFSALTAQKESLERQIASLAQKITSAQRLSQQEKQVVEDPEPLLEQVRERIMSLKEMRAQVIAKQSYHAERAQSLSDQLSRVQELDACPVCKQDVSSGHKDHIRVDVEQELSVISQKQDKLQAVLDRLDTALLELEDKTSSLRKRKELFVAYKDFLQQKKRAKQQLGELSDQESELQQSLVRIQKDLDAIREPLADDNALGKAEKTLSEQTTRLGELSQKQAVLTEKNTHLTTRAQELLQRQERITQAKKQRQAVASKERWVSQGFIPTVAVMEKHVLAAIHQEFSRLFTQWCSLLLDDEHIFATLSSGFAPHVTVHGYDADITHLSGGEKTSLALAYRLSLNAVVNEFMQSLKTTDLLVLDEPTDGFSSDQLDRVRDVLHELSLRQVILVSHEQKMQSYVDRVITVHKREGVSALL